MLAVVLAVGCAETTTTRQPTELLASAKEFKRYRLYHLGSSFEGLTLTAAPDSGGGPATGNPAVDFIYGTCDPGGGLFDEGGCAPPLSVQIWSACERYIALLDVPYRSLKLRGVPAADVNGDARVELQTGDVTIVIFATKLDQALRAANALRSLDGRIKPGDDLPPPVSGALSGRPSGWRAIGGDDKRSGPVRCVRTAHDS
ncbi:MAG: hypothetical protein M3N47_00825 [Chloroflexota bacterium]|nr:hypothetical protein [Chloroflexota bacterium]